MSQSAHEINEALKLYRLAQGTPNEGDAFEHLQSVVAEVKARECCGGRCRFCPVWRGK